MPYSITIPELIKRLPIRDDKPHEWLNKMSDDEIRQWEHEINEALVEEGVPQKFPDWNAAFMAKEIDRSILYDIIKESIYNGNLFERAIYKSSLEKDTSENSSETEEV